MLLGVIWEQQNPKWNIGENGIWNGQDGAICKDELVELFGWLQGDIMC